MPKARLGTCMVGLSMCFSGPPKGPFLTFALKSASAGMAHGSFHACMFVVGGSWRTPGTTERSAWHSCFTRGIQFGLH